MNQWLKIFSSTNLQQASIVKGMLEENNIPVMLINKQDSSYIVLGEIELFVPAHFSALARELMANSMLN